MEQMEQGSHKDDSMKKMESKQEKKEMNKKVFWGPITDKALAELVVKQVAQAFYVVAVIQALFGLIFMFGYIINAILLGAFAFWMHKTKSRIPAIILAILAALSVLGTVINLVTGSFGGVNIVLSVLMAWFAIRAVQATMFLAKK